jgi:hypothetical protein
MGETGEAALASKAKRGREKTDKEILSFSSPNLSIDHLSGSGRLGLDLQYIHPIMKESFHLPSSVQQRKPSDWLCQSLTKISNFWGLTNERECRTLIDVILLDSEALTNLDPGYIHGSC